MDAIYTWIRNIVYYLIIITVMMQLIPKETYRRYIRFFTGLVLILMLIEPIFEMFGMMSEFENIYEGKAYEVQIAQMEEFSLDIPEEETETREEENGIEVEEIQITP